MSVELTSASQPVSRSINHWLRENPLLTMITVVAFAALGIAAAGTAIFLSASILLAVILGIAVACGSLMSAYAIAVHIFNVNKARPFLSEIRPILDRWKREETPANENREEACKRIVSFVTDQAKTKLDLHFLNLTSLPDIFHAPPFTTRLKVLNLALNKLTTLPDSIGQLAVLKELNLFCNLLTVLPDSIGQLRNLKILKCAVTSLTTLPTSIGSLSGLIRLQLNNVHTLRSLPNELLNLSNHCVVNLNATDLSEAVLGRLRERIEAPEYNGPTIHYSMPNDGHIAEAGVGIDQALGQLFTLARVDRVDLSNLTQHGNSEDLRMWLNRLSSTADYKKGGDHLKAFTRKILAFLQYANEHDAFRDVFFAHVQGATETCGDRVALSILHIGIAHRIAVTDPRNTAELAELFIRGVLSLKMLEDIAREKVPTLRFVDEIEVYLGYPIMLRERLGIPIDIEEMLYFRCSSLTSNDLDAAAALVQEAQGNSDTCCEFLIKQDKWIEALRIRFPKEMTAIDEEREKKAEEEYPDYERIEKEYKHGWIALTKTALYNL